MSRDPDAAQPGAADAGIGCAALAWASVALVLIGAVLWTAGILLEDPQRCQGACAWLAFALVFAGAPVSALITVLGAGSATGGDLVLAWPVDVLVWILIGVAHTKLSREAAPLRLTWVRTTSVIVAAALVYGALMALAVERV